MCFEGKPTNHILCLKHEEYRGSKMEQILDGFAIQQPGFLYCDKVL